MAINSEIVVKALIKTANKNFIDAYLIKRGDINAGEIFLKLNNLEGYSMLYSYRKSKMKNPWEVYGSKSWQIESDINKKIDKIIKVDTDVWVIEIEDKEGKFFSI
jgi:hypothetical protein